MATIGPKTPRTITQDATEGQAPLLGSVTQFLDQQRPHLFLWLPVMLGCGIATYFSLRFEPRLPLLIIGPVLAALLLFGWRTRDLFLKIAMLSLALFLIGLCLASVRAHSVAAPVLGEEYFGAVEGRVIGIDRSSSNRVRLTLDQLVLYGVEPEDTPERVRISLSKAARTDRAGDRILVYARLSGPNGPVEPNGFDFRRMAWFNQLGAIGYALGPILPSLNPQPSSVKSWIFELRMTMSDALRTRIPGPNGGFASAILTGDRSGVDPTSLAALRASNLAHLLAISGLHMGLLTGLVFAGARLILALIPNAALRLPVKKIGAVAAIAAGLFYLVLSGASVATQRAFVMAMVVFLAVLLDRPAFTLRGIALAAVIILVLRPESLIGAGFQMSFAATIGLVAAFDVLRRQSWWRTPETRLGKLLRGAFVIAFTSAVAGLATAPISAFHFNQIAQYGLLANVLAVPVMGFVIMPAAIVGILLSPLGLDGPFFWLAGQGIGWVLYVAKWVAGLDGALILIQSGPAIVLGLCCLGGLSMAITVGRPRVLGAAGIVAGVFVWANYDRPDILLDPTARIAGVKSQDGRVVTRARGAGYAASTWLENDGDGATQKIAATRMETQDQLELFKSVGFAVAAEDGPQDCRANTVVLVTKGAPPTGPCLVFDKTRLARAGSVAIWREPHGLRILTSAQKTGNRLWVARPVP